MFVPGKVSRPDLENSSIFIFTEVLFPCVFPWDAEHGFGFIVPHQTRVFPTADLQQVEIQSLSLIKSLTALWTLFSVIQDEKKE